ncbi:MAG: lipopolysaccharide biosynthesis protein [Leadbetterella sp.]
MSILKKLAGDAVWYGLSSILGRFLNWGLVVLHTRVFTQQESLAENAQIYTWVMLFQIIFSFGMETAFFRFGSKKESQNKTFNQILSFILVYGGSLCALIVLFSSQIAGFMEFSGAKNLIQMMAVILYVDTIAAIAYVKMRANNQAKKFAFTKLAAIGINIGLNLFYFGYCHAAIIEGPQNSSFQFAGSIYDISKGPDYIIWANYVASVLTLLMVWKEFVGYRFTLVWNTIKSILVYAYPLMIMGLAGAINLAADRLLLREFLPSNFYPSLTSDQAFSIYAQVYKLSIFMTLVVQAYRYAADPLFFSKMGHKNSPELLAFSTEWFTIACVFLWVGVSLNLDWIQLLIGENYRMAIFIVPLLLLANLFIGVYGNLSMWYKITDKTQYGSYITIGSMIFTVLANMILIPKMGFLASAWVFVISSFGMVAACYVLGQKHYKVNYDIKSLGAYILGAGIIIGIVSTRQFQALWANILFKNIVFGLYLAAVLWHQVKIKKVDFGKKF